MNSQSINFIIKPFLFLIFSLFLATCRSIKKEKPFEKQLKIESTFIMTFSGDIMAHDVNYKMKNYNHIYDDVRLILSADDLSFGNIEMPVCEAEPCSTYPRFNVHRDYLKAAVEGGFDVFSFANNHTNDKYTKGIDGTIASFSILQDEYKEKGRMLFSSGLKKNIEEELKPVLIEKNGWKILFLAITEILNSYDASKNRLYYSAPTQAARKKLLDQIKKMREQNPCDIFVLSIHLYEQEYGLQVLKEKKNWFQELAEAGIDIVWGNHPHVLQSWEIACMQQKEKDGQQLLSGSKNSVFMYSMGNFISGQRRKVNYKDPSDYFEYTGDSALMQIKFKKVDGKLQDTIEIIPILITNYNEDAPIVKLFTKEWIESLAEKDKAYFLKRFSLMQSHLGSLLNN